MPSVLQELRSHLIIPTQPKWMPMNIRIDRKLLPTAKKRHRYMFDDGTLDYLGQILVQMGYNLDGKFRTPQDLGKLIVPFTMLCRGAYINTRVTLDILALDTTPPKEHPQKLREILEPLGFRLHFH